MQGRSATYRRSPWGSQPGRPSVWACRESQGATPQGPPARSAPARVHAVNAQEPFPSNGSRNASLSCETRHHHPGSAAQPHFIRIKYRLECGSRVTALAGLRTHADASCLAVSPQRARLKSQSSPVCDGASGGVSCHWKTLEAMASRMVTVPNPHTGSWMAKSGGLRTVAWPSPA